MISVSSTALAGTRAERLLEDNGNASVDVATGVTLGVLSGGCQSRV